MNLWLGTVGATTSLGEPTDVVCGHDVGHRLWPARYRALDGCRALAALIVVCYHLGLGKQCNMGHIGVMVFFVISGYCIAATSESCMRYGHGFATYMRRRVRRIYPPYILCVCFFAATRLLKWKMGGGLQLSPSFLAWLQTFTLTQWLSLVWHPVTYASANKTLFVAAFWSLNYEEQFYLIIGALMMLSVRLGWPILWGVVLIMIPAFAWNLTHPSISYGFFLEYWVHFSLGALVFYRLCTMTKASARRAVDIGLSVLVVGSGIAWAATKGPGFAAQRSVYAEWFITGTFALLLLVARSLDDAAVRTYLGSKLAKCSTLTYSLYLIHQFNIQSAYGAARLLFRFGVPHLFRIPIEIAAMVLTAAVFWYFCERPFINKPLDSNKKSHSEAILSPTLVMKPIEL
jgi:peptidoglycan/LPS O-acetylase OafA/YrhL